MKPFIISKFLSILTVICLLGFTNQQTSKPNEGTTVTDSPSHDELNIPKFEGNWASQTDEWQVTITRVTGTLFDVKYYHPTEKLSAIKAPGSYSLSRDGKSITKGNKNDQSNFYTITYSNDGRLYTGDYFYTRQ